MIDLDLLTLQGMDGIVVEDNHVIARLIGMVPELVAALGKVAHHDTTVQQTYHRLCEELLSL